jgi:GNS1/SUR4 family
MGSPYSLLGIIGVYLLVIYIIGPFLMKNRNPFELTYVIRVYNVFQIASCLAFVSIGFYHFSPIRAAFTCIPVPKPGEEFYDKIDFLYNISWWFLILRLSEFFETLVFVLRKKNHQVSLLHVYHHIAVVCLLWIFSKYKLCTNECFIPLVNSVVHVFMYSYYFLSSFEILRPCLSRVKICLTAMQIIQLCFLIAHCFIMIVFCPDTKMYWLQVINLAVLIGMFVHFYLKSYHKNEKKNL